VKTEGALMMYTVFLVQYNPSRGTVGQLSALNEAFWGLDLVVSKCEVEATGRLVDLGPLSF
jgi:hypothetical protein